MSSPEIGFDADIKPLFRAKDRDSMRDSFDLWSYADVQAQATAIAARVKDGSMPCDGAWPPEQIALFNRWIENGTPR
jgi:hypothetical protein